MKFNRTKNSKRNIFYGIISKFLVLFLPFITRTVIIKEMGADYLGLNGLFTSVLTVLNVAELGFSNAIVYSMYKPVANDDTNAINALLRLYRTIYRALGIFILVAGVTLIPFLPQFVNGSVPNDINLISLYLIYLLNASISYFAFSYLRSLMSVFQREDILSKITMALAVIQSVLQIAVVITLHNYYAYAIILPVISLLTNLLIAFIANKMFPQYKCEGKVDEETQAEIKQNMKGLVIAKVGGVSRNAFDNIFISAFLGLADVAIYNNYYYISNAVTAMMVLLITSITASIGNSVATESKEQNYNTMTNIIFVYMWIASWCTVCMLCIYQPFMEIWVGEGLKLPLHSMILFCLYFYVLKIGDVQSVYMTTAGLFYEFRVCAIHQAITNIVLNYVLGRLFGIDGIIIATMISIIFIDFLYGNRIVFKFYFRNNKEKEYYFNHLLYFIVTTIVAFCTFIIASQYGIIIRGILCCIVPNILMILIYSRFKIYHNAMRWILKKLKVNSPIVKKVLLVK